MHIYQTNCLKIRNFGRYQRSNEKPEIEEGQPIQWIKKTKGQKDNK